MLSKKHIDRKLQLEVEASLWEAANRRCRHPKQALDVFTLKAQPPTRSHTQEPSCSTDSHCFAVENEGSLEKELEPTLLIDSKTSLLLTKIWDPLKYVIFHRVLTTQY